MVKMLSEQEARDLHAQACFEEIIKTLQEQGYILIPDLGGPTVAVFEKDDIRFNVMLRPTLNVSESEGQK